MAKEQIIETYEGEVDVVEQEEKSEGIITKVKNGVKTSKFKRFLAIAGIATLGGFIGYKAGKRAKEIELDEFYCYDDEVDDTSDNDVTEG